MTAGIDPLGWGIDPPTSLYPVDLWLSKLDNVMANRNNKHDGHVAPIVEGYEHLTQIASGGSSHVYQAHDRRHARSVAIKVLVSASQDQNQRRAFEREAQTMGQLGDHPHVVTLLDSGFTNMGYPFLVMPLFTNGTTADLIIKSGPRPVKEVLDFGVKIASALATCHERGFIHRDVKPSNIFVGPFQGNPILGDFGISALATPGRTTTSTTSLTLMYAAPEVIDDERPNTASDIYSLGATIYCLMEGRPPYEGGTPQAIMRKVLADDPPPLLASNDQTTDAISALVAEMMDKSPNNRPQTALVVAERLNAVQRLAGFPPTTIMVEIAPNPSVAKANGEGVNAPAGTLTEDPDRAVENPAVIQDPETDPNESTGQHKPADPDQTTETVGRVDRPTEPPAEDLTTPRPGGPKPGPLQRPAMLLALAAAAALLIGGVAYAVISNSVGESSNNLATDPTSQQTDETTSDPATVTTGQEISADFEGGKIEKDEPSESTEEQPQDTDTPDNQATTAATDPVSHPAKVRAVDWSPETNGTSRIATGDEAGLVRIWSETGMFIEEVNLEGKIHALEWSPDGESVAIAGESGVHLLSVQSPASVQVLPGFSSSGSLKWSLDGSKLFVGSFEQVSVWNIDGAVVTEVLSHSSGGTLGLALSPDERFLAAGTGDNTVHVWDRNNANSPLELVGHTAAVLHVDFSPDGRLASGGYDRSIRLWNPETGAKIETLADEADSNRFEWSPDGQQFISGGASIQLRVWDLNNAEIVSHLNGHTDGVSDLSWSPDGDRLVTVSVDQTVRVWTFGANGAAQVILASDAAPSCVTSTFNYITIEPGARAYSYSCQQFVTPTALGPTDTILDLFDSDNEDDPVEKLLFSFSQTKAVGYANMKQIGWLPGDQVVYLVINNADKTIIDFRCVSNNFRAGPIFNAASSSLPKIDVQSNTMMVGGQEIPLEDYSCE